MSAVRPRYHPPLIALLPGNPTKGHNYYMYFQKYKTFDVDSTIVDNFANDLLELVDRPTPSIQESINDYHKYRASEGKPIGYYNSSNSYEFLPLKIIKLPFLDKYNNLLSCMLENINWAADKAFVLYFANGNVLMPHTDLADRQYALNIPILNATESKTCFYKHKDPTFTIAHAQSFDFTELTLEAELVYKPSTAYILDVQKIHSVIHVNSGPRMIISVNLTNNLYFFPMCQQLRHGEQHV